MSTHQWLVKTEELCRNRLLKPISEDRAATTSRQLQTLRIVGRGREPTWILKVIADVIDLLIRLLVLNRRTRETIVSLLHDLGPIEVVEMIDRTDRVIQILAARIG